MSVAAPAGEPCASDAVIAALSATDDGATAFRRVVEAVVAGSRADGALVRLTDARDGRTTMIERLAPGEPDPHDAPAARDEGDGPGAALAARVLEHGAPVRIADAADDPDTRGDWPAGTALHALPLPGGRNALGVLIASTSSGGGGECPDDAARLARLAGLAAVAAVHRRLVEAGRGELQRTCAMSEFGHLLSGTGDPADGFETVCRNLGSALELRHASLCLADADGTLVERARWQDGGAGGDGATTPTLAPHAPHAPHTPPGATTALAGTIAAWCHEHGQAADVAADDADPRESADARQARRAAGIGAVCCLPVRHDGRTLGTVLVGRGLDRPDLDENEILLLDGVVNQLAAALGRHALTTALHHQAFHDSLTHLPNRRWLEDELERTLADPVTHGARGAVMFLDLDGFKLVNDSLGHGVGDTLLRHVGERLRRRLAGHDVLARMGGDEFAVIVRRLGPDDDAIGIGERLVEALASAFDIDGARLRIGASVGISHFPDDASTGETLLAQADLAMYEAKGDGKGRVLRFERSLGSSFRRRAELELELREAIERREFRLLYQPQVACEDGRVVGVEALIRWEHPVRGTVSPVEFIPIAEEAGLINAIGAWVLDEALGRLAAWRGTALESLRMSVNIAAPQFLLENFADQVLAALGRHAVDPVQLELEVTESVVMRDLEVVVARLNRLRSAGVRIAIDDFGTGYSSLSYLQDLPLDVLKIDRAFVVRMQDESGGRSLVKTIQLLAAGLGLETVAEGVETLGQRDEIAALGGDLIQGYYHSRPVPPAELPAAIRAIEAPDGRHGEAPKAA